MIVVNNESFFSSYEIDNLRTSQKKIIELAEKALLDGNYDEALSLYKTVGHAVHNSEVTERINKNIENIEKLKYKKEASNQSSSNTSNSIPTTNTPNIEGLTLKIDNITISGINIDATGEAVKLINKVLKIGKIKSIGDNESIEETNSSKDNNENLVQENTVLSNENKVLSDQENNENKVNNPNISIDNKGLGTEEYPNVVVKHVFETSINKSLDEKKIDSYSSDKTNTISDAVEINRKVVENEKTNIKDKGINLKGEEIELEKVGNGNVELENIEDKTVKKEYLKEKAYSKDMENTEIEKVGDENVKIEKIDNKIIRSDTLIEEKPRREKEEIEKVGNGNVELENIEDKTVKKEYLKEKAYSKDMENIEIEKVGDENVEIEHSDDKKEIIARFSDEPLRIEPTVKQPKVIKPVNLTYNFMNVFHNKFYFKYENLFEDAARLVRENKLDDAIEYYKVLLDQKIPGTLKMMIKANIEELQNAILNTFKNTDTMVAVDYSGNIVSVDEKIKLDEKRNEKRKDIYFEDIENI